MYNDNCVIFKGKKDGILIMLDKTANFNEIKEVLKKKVVDAEKFFKGAKAPITFKGRELSDEEESELLDIIGKDAGLAISFVHEKEIADPNKIQLPPPEDVPVLTSTKFPVMQQITQYYKGAVRSGQAIRFNGSVVIIGDVNPGGEVIAEGNIIVLGALKGLVHAGCSGMTNCFVTATLLMPTQLRIADIITCFPDSDKKRQRNYSEVAYIQEGQIYIEQL